MGFRVDLTNFRRFQRRVLSAPQKAKAVARAGSSHVTLIQEAFEVRGVDPVTGQPGVWKDKAVPDPKNVRIKNPPARLFDKTPRLQDTGALVGSINYDPEADGYTVGPAPYPYAAQHQFGAVLPLTPERRAQMIALGFLPSEKKQVVIIPRRSYIVFPRPWVDEIGEAYMSAWMEGAGDASN